MSNINFNLTNASYLGGMAPPALAGGAFGNATLPHGLAGAGIYLIVNEANDNRYVGISNNLAQRFATRMATVTEMGWSTANMNQLSVYWGGIQIQDTPGPGPGAPPLVRNVAGFGAPLNEQVDGVGVQLERLLIRFVLSQFVGGTVSNNMLAFAPYVNPTANPINVTFNWGAGGHFNAGQHTAVWAVGGAGW